MDDSDTSDLEFSDDELSQLLFCIMKMNAMDAQPEEHSKEQPKEEKIEHLSLCSTQEWARNRKNPTAIAHWAGRIAAKMISVLRNCWMEDGAPVGAFDRLLESVNYKHLKMRAEVLAEEFARTGRMELDLEDIIEHSLKDVQLAEDQVLKKHQEDKKKEKKKKKEEEENLAPPSYEELFGAAGVGKETKKTEEEKMDEEDGEPEKKKKKKKKNKNNQKERLRMKRGEKDQLEKKVQAQGVYQGCGTDPCCVVPATVAGGDGSVGKEGDEDQLEKKAQPQQDEKEEGWVVSAPCGNILCNKNAKHRCNKCKKIGFCGQECFEESGHPGRCSGRNEK